jgi:hypothetical protein
VVQAAVGWAVTPEQMHPASAHFHHKHDVEAAQRDGVQGEEVSGQQPRGLNPQERPPAGVCSPWCRTDAGRSQDPADRTGAQTVSEPTEFPVEAPVAPGEVLVCQAQDQVTELVTDRWATGLVGIGPLSGDQAAVPGQQRRGSDDAMSTQRAGEQAGQGGQDRPLRPAGPRPVDLTGQHGHLMAQDQNLEVFGGGAAGVPASLNSDPDTPGAR